jgi:TonB family protein
VRARGLVVTSVLVMLSGAPRVSAQSTAMAPVLRDPVEAPRPSGRDGDEVVVVLALVVGVDGRVSSAEVVESGGEDFDRAALDAARGFGFEPATRDGAPVRARIRYRYVFAPSPIEPVPAAEIPAAEITATEIEAPIDPVLGEQDDVVYQATGVAEAPAHDGASHHVEGAALTQMAGARGDALRVAELMPGVGRPAFGLGVLLIRGAAPQDSQYLLGDVPVPLPYHFGGITSFFSSRLVGGLDLMLSNFGVRYGRATGGILRIDPRDPRRDAVHGHADVNVLDASASVEGPVGPHLSVAAFARRSYIDAILAAAPISGLDSVPAYYDYQAIVLWQPDAANRVRVLLYGSDDQWIPTSSSAAQGAFALRVDNQFHRVQLEWRHDYSSAVRHDVTLALGYDRSAVHVGGVGGSLVQTRTQWPLIARSEWSARVGDQVRLAFGVDAQVLPYVLDFTFQSDAGPTQDPTQPSDDHRRRDSPVLRPALYLESRFVFAPLLEIVVGVRADAYAEIGRVTATPRVVTWWHLLDALDLRAAVGLFSQPPEIVQTLPVTGNPGLGPVYAIHADLGVDVRWPNENVSIGIDGFVRSSFDRVVGPPGDLRLSTSALGLQVASSTGLDFAPTSHLTNEGLGRSWGLELAVRVAPSPSLPLIGFLSYTLMRTEWLDHPSEQWHVSPFDQTHLLTCALTWQIGEGWELGATFRLASGSPYTPIVGAIDDLNAGVYRPIYGSAYAARNAPFHRLDARLSKRFEIGDVGLTIYIDVQNAYNARNAEGVSYDYTYTQSRPAAGLPIIPSLGLRGEL